MRFLIVLLTACLLVCPAYAETYFTSVAVGGGYGATGTTLDSEGNISLDGDLVVDGELVLSGDLEVGGTLTVSGSAAYTTSDGSLDDDDLSDDDLSALSSSTEAQLEALLSDVSDVYTDADGALDDDDLSDDNLTNLATSTEAQLEAHISDATDVFTNNDGSLDDDDLSDDDLSALSDVNDNAGSYYRMLRYTSDNGGEWENTDYLLHHENASSIDLWLGEASTRCGQLFLYSGLSSGNVGGQIIQYHANSDTDRWVMSPYSDKWWLRCRDGDAGTHIGLAIVINGTSTPYFRAPGVYDNTDSTGSYVRVTSEGYLRRSSSARKYKENVNDLEPEVDASSIHQLRPVAYTEISSQKRRYGLIAEEVEIVLPELVLYNQAQEAEDVDYPMLTVFLLAEIQKLRAEVDALKGE